MNHTSAFGTLESTGHRATRGASRSPLRVRPIRGHASALTLGLVFATWLLATAASAQGYANTAYGLSLTPPPGWLVEEQVGEAQNLFLTFRSPSDDAGIAIDAEHLGADQMTDGGIARRDEVENEAYEEIGDHFPGAEVTYEFVTEVGGVEAIGFEFDTPDMYGTVLFAVHEGVLYRMIVFAVPDAIDAAEDDFYDMLDSIVFTSARSGAGLGSPSGGANPLGQADPWLGTFVGDQLTLTLHGGGGSYTGQLVFDGRTYPVRAQGGGGQISGTFSSGGAEFSFTAVASGPQVTFATGGATYALRK